MENIKQQVGQQIRAARKAKGFTQKELGEKMGVSESVVNKYEAGKQNLSLETVQKVAQALSIDLSVILG